MKNNLFNRGKPLLSLLLGLFLIVGMARCGPITKAIYKAKLQQGTDTLKKKYPQFTVKMITDSSGNYQFLTKKGLIQSGKIKAYKPGDTIYIDLVPNYDFLRDKLYNISIKTAERTHQKLKEKLKKKESNDSARRPRDGLR